MSENEVTPARLAVWAAAILHEYTAPGNPYWERSLAAFRWAARELPA